MDAIPASQQNSFDLQGVPRRPVPGKEFILIGSNWLFDGAKEAHPISKPPAPLSQSFFCDSKVGSESDSKKNDSGQLRFNGLWITRFNGLGWLEVEICWFRIVSPMIETRNKAKQNKTTWTAWMQAGTHPSHKERAVPFPMTPGTDLHMSAKL